MTKIRKILEILMKYVCDWLTYRLAHAPQLPPQPAWTFHINTHSTNNVSKTETTENRKCFNSHVKNFFHFFTFHGGSLSVIQ